MRIATAPVGGDFRSIKWDVVSDADALYFVARDVTEGKAAATQLEQDASVMQAVLESVADGLYVADSQGRDDVHQSRRRASCWAMTRPPS